MNTCSAPAPAASAAARPVAGEGADGVDGRSGPGLDHAGDARASAATRVTTTTSAVLALLAVAGLVGPWTFNLEYFAAGGSVRPDVFFRDAFANALTSAITIDVYLAAIGFCIGVGADRGAGRARWWAWPAAFGIGLSFALPAYLAWRLSPGSVDAAPGAKPATTTAHPPARLRAGR